MVSLENTVTGLLEDYLSAPVHAISAPESSGQPDLLLESRGHLILVEAKTTASTGGLLAAREQINRLLQTMKKGLPPATKIIPLLVVPFMGPTVAKICEES